ncbi:MAG TPA: hypothetical protein VK989_17545 [Polyangia bacterium]|nr:hypothetical protein [Polyangia bacterium]
MLTALTIVENGSTTTAITADAKECAASVKGGGACLLTDVAADAGVDGGLTGSADKLCQTTTADWCRCQGDPKMSPMGTWNCDPFAPTSLVYATFDRLIDTTPIDPGDAAAREGIVTIKSTPATPTAVTTETSYSSMGDPSLFFLAGGTPISQGPTLIIQPSPAMPAGTTVTLTLDKTKVRAKDGKTPFTGPSGSLLVDGTLKFNTAAFAVQITVPTAPPPDASADAATDAVVGDGGADAVAEAGSEAGTDAATDAGADGGVADASGAEVAAEAGASDTGTTGDAAASETATSDAATMAPPTPGAPVPADMNTASVTLAFNNTVDTNEPTADAGTADAGAADAGATDAGTPNAGAIQSHISLTEDGKPFTAFVFDVSKAPQIAITPMTVWAPGKTYVVTVDATAADVVGDTLKTPATAAFVMAN